MAKASYHSKMASCLRNRLSICPQGSFEVRPKGRFDFYRLQRSTCFPCGVRNFARAVLKRAENLARLDEDDKAGEPFGFTSLTRHNAFQVMASPFERPLDPRSRTPLSVCVIICGAPGSTRPVVSSLRRHGVRKASTMLQ